MLTSHTAFLTPANAMLSVELTHLADLLDTTRQARNVSKLARKYSATIKKAIWEHTVSVAVIIFASLSRMIEGISISIGREQHLCV